MQSSSDRLTSRVSRIDCLMTLVMETNKADSVLNELSEQEREKSSLERNTYQFSFLVFRCVWRCCDGIDSAKLFHCITSAPIIHNKSDCWHIGYEVIGARRCLISFSYALVWVGRELSKVSRTRNSKRFLSGVFSRLWNDGCANVWFGWHNWILFSICGHLQFGSVYCYIRRQESWNICSRFSDEQEERFRCFCRLVSVFFFGDNFLNLHFSPYGRRNEQNKQFLASAVCMAVLWCD